MQKEYKSLIWNSSLETKSIETIDTYDNLLYMQRVLCLCVNIQAVISEVIPSHKCDFNMGLCWYLKLKNDLHVTKFFYWTNTICINCLKRPSLL